MSLGQDFLGPYQLLRMIRSGQTCVVWEAKLPHESERIAIKALLKRRQGDRREIMHLKHEAMVGKTLNHPAVIRIFDFMDQYSVPFIAMQLFNARNLKQALRDQNSFVQYNVREIILRCAEGLQYLHEQGWVHCDVKPDNFLVDESANVKLIDFSIARQLKKRPGFFARFSKSRAVQGTRSYMSPEQIRGGYIDQRSDLYSFGCVCFELLAGRPPFTGVSPDEVLNKHLKSPVPSLQAYNNRVTPEFVALINQCLAKKPADRPQSVKDFLDAFQKMQVYRPGMRPKLT